MTRWIIIVLTCLIVLFAFGGMSFGQGMSCGKHDEMVAALRLNFQEERHVIALVPPMAIVEVFVSKTGTWTMLATNPNGNACIAAAGINWVYRPSKPAEKDT